MLLGCHTRAGATGMGTGSWCLPGQGLPVGLRVTEVAAMPAFFLLLHPHDAAGWETLCCREAASSPATTLLLLLLLKPGPSGRGLILPH